MLTVFASVLTLGAVATVYKSWRSQTLAFFVIGLLIWLISTIAWSYAHGWEFGVLYALCLPGLLVWPFIYLNQTVLPRPKHTPQPRALNFTMRNTWANIGNALVVLVALLIISVLITLAFCAAMPLSTPGKLALTVVLVPILWGGAIYHYLATTRKGLTLGIYTAVAALSVPVLLVLPI